MTFRDRQDDVRQEEDVVPTKLILSVLAGTLVISFLLSIWAWYSTDAKSASIRPQGEYAEEHLAKPHAISGVTQDIYSQPGLGELLNRDKHHDLATWGWVDQDAGVVRMPIDEAMRVLIEESAQ